MVEAAIETLPTEFQQWLDEVPIIVEDRPDEAGTPAEPAGDEEPLGLYVGGTRLEGNVEGLPARIMIYRIPLMDACTTREALAEEIRKTLVHELGHHAGMDEEELERRGYGPIDDQIEWDTDED